ncbi:hypothetical protein EVC30_068 [Rhizobium phage RHph_Y1_11]|nr:hypothetical protein EVC30_068 [Rhizobium phage RHph_Y1_11]
MSRETGYHINVAKIKPDNERSQWDKAHNTGYHFYCNIQLGQYPWGSIEEQFQDACRRYPIEEGFTLSLIYVPGITQTMMSTHAQVSGHSLNAASIHPDGLPPHAKIVPAKNDDEHTVIVYERRPYYG